MGYDERTAERVRRILSRRGDSVEKRMMGGAGLHGPGPHVLRRQRHRVDGARRGKTRELN